MAFVMVQKVLFKHCDPAGIVFFPRYFEMMNDCVETFFDEIGLPFDDMHTWGGVPTVNVSSREGPSTPNGPAIVPPLESRISKLPPEFQPSP